MADLGIVEIDMVLRQALDYLYVVMVEFVFPIAKTVIHDEPY